MSYMVLSRDAIIEELAITFSRARKESEEHWEEVFANHYNDTQLIREYRGVMGIPPTVQIVLSEELYGEPQSCVRKQVASSTSTTRHEPVCPVARTS